MRYKLPNGFYIFLFVILLIANTSVYKTILSPNILSVSVLEVGKGRAVLVKIPENNIVLIDTGPDASILRALGESLPVWRRDIDAVILTSSAAGSASGLSSVQSRYHVTTVIKIGNATIPYGTSFVFGNSRVEILAPSTLQISSGSSVFNISSSTPSGVYYFN
ncbi:MAG: hypothetical protein AAB555_03090 [Patescibacteria group bacterium]